MIGNYKEEKVICKNIFFGTFIAKDMKVFLKIGQKDKTNASDPKYIENCWMKTLGSLASDWLNVEYSV